MDYLTTVKTAEAEMQYLNISKPAKVDEGKYVCRVEFRFNNEIYSFNKTGGILRMYRKLSI